MALGQWALGLALVLGAVVVQADSPVRAESYTVTEGYEAKPDNDPFHYFPTRPHLREGMEEMAAGLSRDAHVTRAVRDAILQDLTGELESTAFFFSADVMAEALYEAAIAARDCRLADDLVWQRLVELRPFMVSLRGDSAFDRILRQRLYRTEFPGLAACLYADDARTLSVLIARHSMHVTGTRTLVRPFLHHESWFSARGTLHGRRDYNFWQLIEMVSDPTQETYAPAGVLLVELALELDSLNLPNDILHMLLLRADASWSALDPEYPSPVPYERIAELLTITAARLSDEQLARAERCSMSDEPYTRLFLGEAGYAEVPEDERCQAP
ncbi:MAG: hypothetical protein AAGH43_13165 [Pseudomonadota bacterium]